MPSVVTNPPKAHSKSPMRLCTIKFALDGSSNTVAGTLFGATTSRRREVSHAVSAIARRSMPPFLLSVIGMPSVRDADGEQERRELRELGLVERNRTALPAEAV